MTKRVFDICVSVLGLILLSPLILLVALIILAADGRPVLFRQERPGKHGRPFEILKFRTMKNPSDRDGLPQSDASRLTSLGRFLRSTSVDELPELWNVLVGEMSLVGPRPLLMEYLPMYTDEQARRHEVRPGITGLAQVQGRNNLEWAERFKLDVWYVDNKSMALDFRIMVLTVYRVLRRENIAQEGHVSMEAYRGDPES